MNMQLILKIVAAFSLTATSQPESIVSETISTLDYFEKLLNEVIDTITKARAEYTLPFDCQQIRDSGESESGIYKIKPLNWKNTSFLVYCDMTTEGGGWTVIQRRIDYRENFDKEWKAYSMGFGNLSYSFWLGNEKIYALTNQGNYSLRIDMKYIGGGKGYATYKTFRIEDEKNRYRLHVSGFTGDADLLSHVDGANFITQDGRSSGTCSIVYGAWWYNFERRRRRELLFCNIRSNLNYKRQLFWKSKNDYISLSEVDMKIKRIA